ncbi:hypothetical protein LTR74_006954 [Friedmanniomyces endolithicus]|nr:hypothetical protein LTR74_006954 [Friedmanniomyces endolithicus]
MTGSPKLYALVLAVQTSTSFSIIRTLSHIPLPTHVLTMLENFAAPMGHRTNWRDLPVLQLLSPGLLYETAKSYRTLAQTTYKHQALCSPRATTKPNQTTNQPTMMDSKNPASHKEDGAMIPIKDIPSMSLGRPLVRVPLVPRLAAATPLFTKRTFGQKQTRVPQVSRYAALFAEQAKAKAAKEAEMNPRAVKVAARADDIFWIVQAVLQAFRIRANAAQVVRSTYGPMLVRRAPAKVDQFDGFGGPVVGVGHFTGMLYHGVPAELIKEVCEGVCERSASLNVEDDEEVEYEESEAESEAETEAESEAGVEAEDDYDILSWSGRMGDSPAY